MSMTRQEAVYIIKIYGCLFPTREQEALAMAVEALARMEPQEPIRNDKCTCPHCGTHNEIIKKRITPSWDDMCMIKDIFFKDDECAVQYHPPKSEYVNNMPNCLHLWRPLEATMPMPRSILVGIKQGQSMESFMAEKAAIDQHDRECGLLN